MCFLKDQRREKRIPSSVKNPENLKRLGLELVDEFGYVTDGLNFFSVFVGDFDTEFFFESHH
ncbi:hypothetical protein LEP1GSC194_0621 [Leptospira alstonii serovar Sichuan str. 79601]|uniref:Uncharacterized protein n=1 Tax=Leptospira alstonii serovar Sichuan str. 79601 TaxID=1218565 RepID=M6CID4_9LEPT|nr:hypothetical protein LEP1GSC194_0621 [Leptospira alstonii serovar Sichuan str. 79601]